MLDFQLKHIPEDDSLQESKELDVSTKENYSHQVLSCHALKNIEPSEKPYHCYLVIEPALLYLRNDEEYQSLEPSP